MRSDINKKFISSPFNHNDGESSEKIMFIVSFNNQYIALISGFSNTQINDLIIRILIILDTKLDVHFNNFVQLFTQYQNLTPQFTTEIFDTMSSEHIFSKEDTAIIIAKPKKTALHTEKIKFFDLEYESSIPDQIINIDKYVYYHDIYCFIDHLKELTIRYEKNVIKKIFTNCFRGSAFI